MKKTPATYARALHDALLSAGEGQRRGIIRAMLNELGRVRKTNLRPRIVAAFCELALASEGYRAGRITTAREIDAATRAKFKKVYKNVVFEEYVDPSLLGGAIVEVEDERTDGSVRAHLNTLKHKLSMSHEQ